MIAEPAKGTGNLQRGNTADVFFASNAKEDVERFVELCKASKVEAHVLSGTTVVRISTPHPEEFLMSCRRRGVRIQSVGFMKERSHK